MEFSRYRLPFICAISGEPAAWYAKVEVRKPLHPAAFLLIVLGPIGWLVLLAMALRSDGTYVEVPISQQVYDEIHERRRRLRWLLGVLVVSVVVFAWLANSFLFPAAWLVFLPAIGMGFWVGMVKGHYRMRLSVDGVGLVTLRRVHPAFVAAVEDWRRGRSDVTAQP